jgi:hypothetical protein
MTYNKKITDTNIRVGEVRFSYCNVFSPRQGKDGQADKYSACVIIPQSDKATVAMINDAIEAAKAKGKAEKWGGKVPANCKLPLRDGDVDREDDEAFAGCYFLNASTKNKPGVKVLEDGSVGDALDDEDFYSGCYGAVTLNFFPYDQNGNRGVGVGLNNVIKTRDGERLSGGRSADEDFGDLGVD